MRTTPGIATVFAVVSLLLAPALPAAAEPAPSSAPRSAPPRQPVIAGADVLGQLPLSFEENRGRIAGDARFVARTSEYTLLLASTGATFEFPPSGPSSSNPAPGARMTMGFADASVGRLAGEQPLMTRSNYVLGSDPRRWIHDVPHVRAVRYADVYPGIDAVFYGRSTREIEFDFVVQPGAQPADIRLRFDGATSVDVRPDGALVVNVGTESLHLRAPVAYQEGDSGHDGVDVAFERAGDATVRFRLGDYDRSRPLVIDPVIDYSTYLNMGEAGDVAVDGIGNMFVVGRTTSRDNYVAKIRADGQEIIFITHFGGTADEYPREIALDSAFNPWIAGHTSSPDLPLTPGAVDTTCHPHQGGCFVAEVFVAKFDTHTGQLLYSTYLGGNHEDLVAGIALDGADNVYITGETVAGEFFPVLNPIQPGHGGSRDLFLTKFDASGAMVYSILLGGTHNEMPAGLAVDPAGNVYIAGNTNSPSFPTTAGVLQPKPRADHTGIVEGFVIKFNSDREIVYATYLGGSRPDTLRDLALDADGNVYLVGFTASSDFPGGNPNDPNGRDFVAKLDSAGSSLLYTSFLVGEAGGEAQAVAVDGAGSAYVVGRPSSSFSGELAGAQCEGTCVFAMKIDPAGSAILYNVEFGGSNQTLAGGMTLDAEGDLYIAGETSSFNFLLVRHLDRDNPHGRGFLTKIMADDDEDGLPNTWERRFGLDAETAAGDAGAAGDPDGDGTTNLEEYRAGTHPRGFVTRYLAEGATGSFFFTRIALANPGDTPAAALLRFSKADGSAASHFVAVPPKTRRTVNVEQLAGLVAAEFSTLIEADTTLVVDRTMWWDKLTGYGSHAESAIAAPAARWYLAEGATHSGFNLFYLVQNVSASPVPIDVTYLRPSPAPPIVKTYVVPARSRFNIWVNLEDPALADAEVSAILDSRGNPSVIVERAMYLDAGGLLFGAGHGSAGVTAPAMEWFLPEGATGPFFDLFVLLANPGDTPAAVTATYLLPTGATVVKSYTIGAKSRQTVWVDVEDPQLADTAVSTIVTSTNGVPIVVERAMWWPGPTAATWHEAHNSAGATVTGTAWGLAEGEIQGPPPNSQTYILVANTANTAATVKVTLLFEDGTSPVEQTFQVPGNSRFNVSVRDEFPAAVGKAFGAIVESLGNAPAPIVVERAIYTDAFGVTWAGGSSALATRLR